MSFVNKNGLNKLCPFANDFTEDDGLFEEEYLQFFELFRRQFTQLRGAVKLAVKQQFPLGGYLALSDRIVKFRRCRFSRVSAKRQDIKKRKRERHKNKTNPTKTTKTNKNKQNKQNKNSKNKQKQTKQKQTKTNKTKTNKNKQ